MDDLDRSLQAFADVIYNISPVETPFIKIWKFARVRFRPYKSANMRKNRRRVAKPLKFTPSSRAEAKKYMQTVDKPQ